MKLFITSILLSFLLIGSACDPAKPVSVSQNPVSKNRFPSTNLPMPPSKPVEKLGWKIFDSKKDELLGDYKGKVVVLDFWATYCPPCIKAIPHLNELKAKYGDKGFEVIGLHVGGEEDAPKVPSYMERFNVDYPIATPEDELTYSLLGTDNRIPQTLIFDREGKLVKQFVSYDDAIKSQLDEVIEKTVNQE